MIEESWIIQLSPTVNQRALAEAVRLLPKVVADARQVAHDSAAMNATLLSLAHEIADDGTRFPGSDRMDVSAAALAGRRALRAADPSAAPCRKGWPRSTSQTGWVWRCCAPMCCRAESARRTGVAGLATLPSFLRYGAYPYIVVVREASASTSSSTASSACSPSRR